VAYTAEKPKIARSSDELRQTIVGWGADLDPANRPSVPMEKLDPSASGAHWTFPERQVPTYEREKSTEHRFLTPVFGTVCPPRGLSGAIRRYAYTFSEARSAHWTLLVLADRVDVVENRVMDILRLAPPNMVAEMGLGAEIKRHGLRSRFGRQRTDVKHLPVDVLMFAASTALVAGGVLALAALVRPKPKKSLLRRLLG